jgi:hypothetical protein
MHYFKHRSVKTKKPHMFVCRLKFLNLSANSDEIWHWHGRHHKCLDADCWLSNITYFKIKAWFKICHFSGKLCVCVCVCVCVGGCVCVCVVCGVCVECGECGVCVCLVLWFIGIILVTQLWKRNSRTDMRSLLCVLEMMHIMQRNLGL